MDSSVSYLNAQTGMKKKVLVLAMGMFMVFSSVMVFMNPSDANTASRNIKAPLKVLFDFTKHEDAGNADWRIDGAYSSFADALRNEGFEVDSLGTGSGEIKSSDLSGYSVLVLPEPQNEFTADEKNAILDFVNNGGGLVYIADHKSSDRDNDGWDSWSIWNDNLDFDTTFGITLESTQSGNSGNNEVTDIEQVDILTDNLTSFGSWLGTTMSVSGDAKAAAYQTISGNRLPVLAYATYGNGRVVVHCDSSTFDDGTPDSDNSGDSLSNNWDDYDDATLAVNLVKWAANYSSGGGEGAQELTSHTGKGPYVSYGNGNYLLAFYNGKYVNATIVHSSDGTATQEFNVFNYGSGLRSVYNPDGDNFTVAAYDYSLPNFHKVIMRFVNHDTTLGKFYTVSNDANTSMDVAYGHGKILIVWVNLSREQIKGSFYDTQSAVLGSEFTIATGGAKKYNVAVGYDSLTDKFLVVWTENYDVRGVFVSPDGSIANSVNFPSTPDLRESMLSAAGGDGRFFVSYRNGSFSSAKGIYLYVVDGNGNVESKVVNDNPAEYCGAGDVRWVGDEFMLTFADTRNGNQDVFVRFFDSSGNPIGDEIVVKNSQNSEETPTGYKGNSTMLIAWYDYTSKYVGSKYYPPSTVPEITAILPILILVIAFLVGRRKSKIF